MGILLSCLKAFLVGGAICLVGQVLIDFTKLTPARILVSFVVSGVLLTALGCYEPIVEFAGAGATVPLTGFIQRVKWVTIKFNFPHFFFGAIKTALSQTFFTPCINCVSERHLAILIFVVAKISIIKNYKSNN